jgi:hypothetical protein
MLYREVVILPEYRGERVLNSGCGSERDAQAIVADVGFP